MKMREDAPCLKCEERWVQDGKRCHSECERYKAYVERRDARYQYRKTQWELSDYEAARREKIKKRLNLGR